MPIRLREISIMMMNWYYDGLEKTLSLRGFQVSPTAFKVYDGLDNKSPLIGTYCGQSISSKIRSTSNALHVRFTSDGTINGAGFAIEFSSVKGIVEHINI